MCASVCLVISCSHCARCGCSLIVFFFVTLLRLLQSESEKANKKSGTIDAKGNVSRSSDSNSDSDEFDGYQFDDEEDAEDAEEEEGDFSEDDADLSSEEEVEEVVVVKKSTNTDKKRGSIAPISKKQIDSGEKVTENVSSVKKAKKSS